MPAPLLAYPIKANHMIAFFLFILFLFGALFLLNNLALKKTGIKDAIFYFKCESNAWIVETAWINDLTGQVYKIITTSNWQDGVLSVLNQDETIYHTKQPFTDRNDLLRFHRLARRKFFNEMKLRSFIDRKWINSLQ